MNLGGSAREGSPAEKEREATGRRVTIGGGVGQKGRPSLAWRPDNLDVQTAPYEHPRSNRGPSIGILSIYGNSWTPPIAK
ncbi:hypothetical protein VUR80DRAFT_828 [Thermomyces stellatus]